MAVHGPANQDERLGLFWITRAAAGLPRLVVLLSYAAHRFSHIRGR